VRSSGDLEQNNEAREGAGAKELNLKRVPFRDLVEEVQDKRSSELKLVEHEQWLKAVKELD
jgi:hypothetical protein